MEDAQGNWPGYRGGTRRLGCNPTELGTDIVTTRHSLTLNLGSECRSLLAYDGHLVAISHHGVVEVADVAAGQRVCRFQVPGPVIAQACIHNGVLYLAAGRQLIAHSLGSMTSHEPRVRSKWTLPLTGTAVHALTPVENRLYVTVASPGWQEIQAVDDVDRPAAPRIVHGAARVSWLAADERDRRLVFFSRDDDDCIHLHVEALGRESELTTHAVSLRHIPEHPIAVIRGSIFGVFGDAHRLYRIDASTGAVAEALEEDAQFFALGLGAAEEWNRDSVVIDSSGILFSRGGVRDTFGLHDRAVKGSPLIAGSSAVVVGMEDGRVRIYNLTQLPRHEVWLVGQGSAAITALACFNNYVAAGNREGLVEIREIRAQGGAS